MSSFLTLLGALTSLFIVLASQVNAIVTFQVGDSEGWHNPGMDVPETYTLWTSTKKFHVGDSLWFEYKNDSVIAVDKWGYYHCDTTNPSSVFNDGNTTIVLDNPGKMYFISGDPQHCEEGQRMFVNVIPLPPRISHLPLDSPAPSPSPSPNSGSKAVPATMLSLLLAFSVAVLVLALAWVVI